MSGTSPAAQPLPVDRAARLVLYNMDVDYDGKIGPSDSAPESKAVLALAGVPELSTLEQVQAWVARYDVANRIGLPGRDGALDQAELGRLVLDIRQMVEHQDPRLSVDVAVLGASILRQVDVNRDTKISAADGTLVARALLRMANNATQLDQVGLNALLARYDGFDAANRRAGADGKIGPLEMEVFQADLQAAAASLPPAAPAPTPAPAGSVDGQSTGSRKYGDYRYR